MKAYDKRNCLFGTLIFDDLGMAQSQAKSSKFHCLSLHNDSELS